MKLKLYVFILLVPSLFGCFHMEGSSSNDVIKREVSSNPKVEKESLIGSWVLDACIQTEGKWHKEIFTFSDTTMEFRYTYYSDSNCVTKINDLILYDLPYFLADEVTTDDGLVARIFHAYTETETGSTTRARGSITIQDECLSFSRRESDTEFTYVNCFKLK